MKRATCVKVALAMAVARHEQAFGVLETDVQRRIVHQPTSRA